MYIYRQNVHIYNIHPSNLLYIYIGNWTSREPHAEGSGLHACRHTYMHTHTRMPTMKRPDSRTEHEALI